MKHREIVGRIVEAIVWHLRRENILVSTCEIREKTSKYEVFLRLEDNAAGLSTIKIIYYNNNPLKTRIYTGRTSLDLRLKRIVKRELEKMVGGDEDTTQG